ncbi:ferredoxin-NADP reductase [Microbacterium sp. SLBN-154]|uniref:PDR/VanB family oxidoreductase n=1 Tax=Microbacterium sp. SLBN-154 TaxID=2768458 RepID=UPI0011538FA6|nr:PDR/VanB family oxidoreductase [Microbacterium sp. SLBN-154]TQK17646.1 ferredoxin-NADP reductase [Microbacterium sp. SLBN-154]
MAESDFVEAVVIDRKLVADEVARIDLRLSGYRELDAWTPGAHIDIRLPTGAVRQYSLIGDASDLPTLSIAVLREDSGRGASRWLHQELTEGQVLKVRGPFNHFPLVPASRYTFVAGGIGITPLLPMVRAAAAAGLPWRVLYAGRSRSRLAFVEHLTAMGDVTVFASDEGRRLDLSRLAPASGEAVYACGPARMLNEVVEHARTWNSATLHLERFEPVEATPRAFEGIFHVDLEASQLELAIPPERSILDVVEEAGVFVLSSCREGTCGTCETFVLEGTVDHHDSVLTAEQRAANDRMMICVSRSATPRLRLDL